MTRIGAIGLTLFVAATPGSAQLIPAPQLPGVGGAVDRVTGLAPQVDRTLSDARALVQAQTARMRDLVRRHPDRIALDARGNAARAGELIVLDADAQTIVAAQARGFELLEQVDLAEMAVGYARFATPRGMALAKAEKRLRGIARGKDVSADQLHFASGATAASAPRNISGVKPSGGGGRIGIIDGGVSARTPGLARQQGFAEGAPRPHDHAAAIASILTGDGVVRASAPRARLYVADVYGADPAGGNATAIARALIWMTREKVPVVVISLVGPPNALLARIVVAARKLGTVVVAAVGNDGPAAAPAYPASYAGAISVTGVDARGRPLIEAGRAAKIDYAAPGADLLVGGTDGKARKARGTSFAAPFVAARLSAHLNGDVGRAIRSLDREAQPGNVRRVGRGILCGDCATRPR
ncbi:S8 family serine peptidase [Sphingomonas suaedae]|nr:S8 family serine peptidase [Sphingomonas suaedae]